MDKENKNLSADAVVPADVPAEKLKQLIYDIISRHNDVEIRQTKDGIRVLEVKKTPVLDYRKR